MGVPFLLLPMMMMMMMLFLALCFLEESRATSIHRQQYSLKRPSSRGTKDNAGNPVATTPTQTHREIPSEEHDDDDDTAEKKCGTTNRPYTALVREANNYRHRSGSSSSKKRERLVCVDRTMIEDMRTSGKTFQLQSESDDRETFERLRALEPGEAPGGSMGLYHDYGEMVGFLRAMQTTHPDVVRLHSLGETLGHREILAVQLTRHPNTLSPGRPRIKFVANIHGNEAVGRELLLHFVQDLTMRYIRRERRIVQLLNTTEVWVVPSINPDGFELGVRSNAADRDLNRDYPDQFTGSPRCVQPETRAIMEWTLRGPGSPFAISLALHGGSLVVNYPFDGNADFRSRQESPSQDDAEFRALALAYASNSVDIASNSRFRDGITNGAAWYVLNGGSQDWNYLEAGCMEVTAEVSRRKFPEDTELASHWANNREPLLRFAEQVHEHGVWGYVLDIDTGRPVRNAHVYVAERPGGVHSPVDKYYAAYWRYLLEGHYTLVASAEGYQSVSKAIMLPRMGTRRIDFMIKKQQQRQHQKTGRRSPSVSLPPVCK